MMRSATWYSLSVLAALAATTLFLGCSYSATTLRMEPPSVARQLGVPRCRVSVPLTQAEALREARSWGNPNPEANPAWAKIVADTQPGDQLRLIDCMRTQHHMYFAHIHNDSIVTEVHPMFFD